MTFKKINRRGADLIQTSLYGIIAVGIIAAAYVSFNSVNTNNKAQASAQQFLRVHSIIQQAHASSGDYGYGNLSNFLKGHGFPVSEVSASSPPLLKSPSGTPFTTSAQVDTEFRLRYTGLKKIECERIFNAFVNLNGAIGVHFGGKTTSLSNVDSGFINSTCSSLNSSFPAGEVSFISN